MRETSHPNQPPASVMNKPTTPPLIYESVRDFLIKHPPYSRMKPEALQFFIPRLKLAYFPKGAVIVDREGGPFPPFHIIQTGSVSSVTAGLDTLPDRILSQGECFPVGALSAGGKPTRTYRAIEDVFAYQLGIDDFNELRSQSPEFETFCTAAITVLAQQSLAELQRHYAEVAADQHSLTRPLADIVARDPVTCSADTSLRDALLKMREHVVRSIIIVDADEAPVGVFTLNDLRDRVVLKDVPLTTPIAQVMTKKPSTLEADATAADAMQQMAVGKFHQMIVTQKGRIFGIVAEHDLFAMQRVSLRQIHNAIQSARTNNALAHVAGDIRNLAHNLLAQGVHAETLTRTVSTMNDALTREVITRTLREHDLTDIDWCWMALGSEGREEQTLATDQDNALIFSVPNLDDTGEELRARRELLAFARDVNAALNTLGFPLCKGGVMAGNPEWCLTAREWREKFTQWLYEPTPEALLRANIYFDFRALYGDDKLTASLSQWLLARTQDNRLFLRLMGANALQTDPPVGLIRAFVVDDDADPPGTIDLKARGTRLFVDAARLFALALGVGEANTVARMRKTGEILRVDRRHVDAAIDAFQFLQMLRLRSQNRRDAGGSPNRIDPYALNDVDQRMLKESFRQARKVQQQIKESHAIGM
jgi:CBS domain-containing protein